MPPVEAQTCMVHFTREALSCKPLNIRIKVTGNVCALYVGGVKTALTSITTSLFPSGAIGLCGYSPNSGASSQRGR